MNLLKKTDIVESLAYILSIAAVIFAVAGYFLALLLAGGFLLHLSANGTSLHWPSIIIGAIVASAAYLWIIGQRLKLIWHELRRF